MTSPWFIERKTSELKGVILHYNMNFYISQLASRSPKGLLYGVVNYILFFHDADKQDIDVRNSLEITPLHWTITANDNILKTVDERKG